MERADHAKSIVIQLQNCLPDLLRAILKQLSLKSVSTKQQCFILLRHTTEALNGGLASDTQAICRAAVDALRSIETATSSSLSIAALSFLSAFFKNHSVRVFGPALDALVPAIVRCMKDKLQRINFEAFSTASSLARSVRPKGASSPSLTNYSEPIQALFVAATDVLADSSVDGEVRERALDALGNLLVHEGDLFTQSYSTCLPLITDRLSTETTATTAVQVIGKIADSSMCKGQIFDQWLLSVLPEVVVTLRRSRRASGKAHEFNCIRSIVTSVGTALPADTAANLLAELQRHIQTPQALTIIALILTNQPSSRPTVQSTILPNVLEAIKTPSIDPNFDEALTTFFGSYVDGDVDCVTRLVPTLIDNLGKAVSLPDATQGGTSAYATAARCIGAVVQHSQRNEAGILAVMQKTIRASQKHLDRAMS